jgi:hypothetical protein
VQTKTTLSYRSLYWVTVTKLNEMKQVNTLQATAPQRLAEKRNGKRQLGATEQNIHVFTSTDLPTVQFMEVESTEAHVCCSELQRIHL